jgi:hypothetical protein
MRFADRLIARITRRAPDFVIGGQDRPYLLRWWVIPKNRFFNIYLHQFLRSDDDRAHHDHPWLFNASWLLRGAYVEHTIKDGGLLVLSPRAAGAFKFRWGAAPHRLALLPAVGGHEWSCWTLFITGPVVRQWGFYCMERGWVHWRRFTSADDPGAIGRGCDA